MGNPIDAIFGNNKPPPAPDLIGLSEQDAKATQDLLQQQTAANRVNQYSPYGKSIWAQDRNDPNKWSQTISFTPEQRRIFEAQQAMQQGQAQYGLDAVNQAGDIFSSPFEIPEQVPTYQGPQGDMPQYQGPQGDMPEYSGPEGDMPTYGTHRQNVYDAMMARVGTDIDRDRGTTNSQLVAQGIPVGSKAYNRQMEQLDRKETDAKQQAEIAAEQMAGLGYQSALAGRGLEGRESMADFTTGMAGRQQGQSEGLDTFRTGMQSHQQQIQDALLGRNQPINEMNAWQTGSQIGMPQFQGYSQAGFAGGPDYLGAGMGESQYNLGAWNADTASNNALMGGLFGLGAAGIGAYPW